MKKSVLALSISTAIGTFAMVGSAFAITDLGVTASVGTATSLKVNNSGIGHNLIVPYYSAQAANATLLTLTNTTSTGKAVKVRFRGAENSDDVLDFQVFLSPNDVWTANASQSSTGEMQVTTADKSCTKPTFIGGVLKSSTTRLSSAANKAGTREGYIEIFNMADVGAGTVATAITHVAGVAPCASAGFTTLDTNTTAAALVTAGLALPTTGLTASWVIINTATGAAFGGNATAIQALTGAFAPGTGNLVYWPQSTDFVTGETRGFTADPLLMGNLLAVPAVTPAIKALMQDLPDMSTPYISGLTTAPAGAATVYSAAAGYGAVTDSWAATAQAVALSSALAVSTVTNEFFSDSASVAIGAATDWVFTMPTRRYNVAYNYALGATAGRTYNNYTWSYTSVPATGLPVAIPAKANFFTAANTQLSGTTICVDTISVNGYNREEGINSNVTASPSTVPLFCGEAGVWGVNQTILAGAASAVLQGAVTTNSVSFSPVAFSEGWMRVVTNGLLDAAGTNNLGVPILGTAFTKASSTASTNYGWNTDHRFTRPVGYAY